MLLEIIERYTLCIVRERIGYRTQVAQRRPQGTVCRHKHPRVLGLSAKDQELLAQGMRRLQLGADKIIIPQSTQHGETLMGIFQVFTELPSRRVDLLQPREQRSLS